MASVEKRGENTYRMTACCGYSPEGKKLFKKKTITITEKMTSRQLEKYLDEQKHEFEKSVKSGNFFDGGHLTFGEYTVQWLERVEKELAPATLHTYRLRVERRIIPALGSIKLADLKRVHLKTFYESLANDGKRLDVYYVPTDKFIEVSVGAGSATARGIGIDPKTFARVRNGSRIKPEIAEKISKYYGFSLNVLFKVDKSQNKLSCNTINHHYDLISSILTAAVDDELIAKSPQPKAPKVTPPKRTYYNEEQLQALLGVFDDEPIMYHAMGYLLIDTGMRRSELTGLKWKNVDFENNTVFINEQRQHFPKYGEVIKDPKTESGTRLISVSPTVMSIMWALHKHQKENKLKLGSNWIENDYVFKHDDGNPIYPNRPYQWLNALTEKHELPKLTVHGARHTNASYLMDNGIKDMALSSRLGHANVNVTNTVYVHEMKAKKKVAANVMEEFYTRKTNDTDKNKEGNKLS